jgi:hypothetical protein
VAGSTPLSRRAGGEFRPLAPASLGWCEIRRSRTGAAQGSASSPERRTGEPDQRRGLTPTGPRRSHWAHADGKKVRGYGLQRRRRRRYPRRRRRCLKLLRALRVDRVEDFGQGGLWVLAGHDAVVDVERNLIDSVKGPVRQMFTDGGYLP